jgi:hypothetical protein
MVQFDLTSFFAAITFFVNVVLYIKKSIQIFDFLYFLLIVEGIIFLAGAISINREVNHLEGYKIRRTFRDIIYEKSTSSPARINQIRYFFGLFFLCTGIFINKLAVI